MDRDLNKLGLMQLRIYAKSIGVKAPTACTKTKLIEKIKQVKAGIVPPHFTDRGRPQINTFIDFMDNLNEKNTSPNNSKLENLELKKKMLELNNITIKIEKNFYEFKKTLIEIINDL